MFQIDFSGHSKLLFLKFQKSTRDYYQKKNIRPRKKLTILEFLFSAKIQFELTDACHVKNIDLMKSRDAVRTIPVLDASSTKTVLQRWISVRPIAQPLRQQPRN
jgi:hypothetical protein